jgi:DegV family protein with EDD domain
MYIQEIKDKFIYVFDSRGCSVKQTLICLKIKELIDLKMDETKIVENVNEYVKNMKFFFQLGSLDTLVKNGRISKYKGILANTLNIKALLYGSEAGEVELLENVRSEKKAKKRLVEIIGELSDDFEGKIIGISHCNALEKANWLKKEIMDKYNFKSVLIVESGGLSSIYMNDGGITISF